MSDRIMSYMTSPDGIDPQVSRASSPRPAAKLPGHEIRNKAVSTARREQTCLHTIQKGENLFRIGMRYGVKVDDILKWNNLPSKHKIKEGEKLLIMTKDTGSILPSEPVEGRKTIMNTSAYNSKEAQTDSTPNVTAYGTKTRWGVVAADPSVFPRGTKLYIEGFGYAVVEDTGRKVKGNRIDIWMKDEKQAVNWGRRKAVVIVLEE